MNLQKLFLSIALLVPASALLADSCGASSASCGASSASCGASSNDCGSNSSASNNGCGSCHSIFIPRAQNANTAVYGWLPFAHQYGKSENYWGSEMNLGFQQSFSGKDLAKGLFGTDELVFQGSDVANRSSKALVADYFGLPADFEGSLKLNPRIRNIILNGSFYAGFDECLEGLYARLDVTFANQRRSLRDCVVTNTAPLASEGWFADNYMGYVNVNDYAVQNLKQALNGQTSFGDMTTAWQFGRFAFCEKNVNAIASVDLNVGWDFLRCDDYYLGLFVRGSAPTGNKVNADYSRFVFAPMVGNGHHWELGGGIDAGYHFWKCDNKDRSLSLYLDGYVTHLFQNCQVRSFDFNLTGTGCMSRYMLLKGLLPDTTVGSLEGYVYNYSLINAINFTTRNAKVTVNVKGDASLRLVFHDNNWDIGLGYNIYGHSADSVCINSGLNNCGVNALDPLQSYGAKGAQNVYYTTAEPATQFGEIVSLNATATKTATAFSIGDTDNAQDIVSPAFPIGVQDSNPAVLVSVSGLNAKSGASPRQLTNKGFVSVAYNWSDCQYAPYLALVGEAEGGSRNTDLSLWGVHLKGGMSY